jgi:hypothetical protein
LIGKYKINRQLLKEGYVKMSNTAATMSNTPTPTPPPPGKNVNLVYNDKVTLPASLIAYMNAPDPTDAYEIRTAAGLQRSSLAPIEDCPEKRLMFAILNDAIAVLTGHCYSKNKNAYLNAHRWIFEEDLWEWATPFTFSFVCEALGLTPSYMRKGIKKELQRQKRLKAHEVRVSSRVMVKRGVGNIAVDGKSGATPAELTMSRNRRRQRTAQGTYIRTYATGRV